ncbi:MAG TPA: glutamate--tRNA ligase [Actinomycetota bacterium]|nr:glutamate--tRNA ligase [Actinomycetota bacterium]
MSDGGPVRCRIAPAPTGYLHVGNARAALFNWLFARHHGGVFVLRVEDTDLKRSTEEAIGIIISSLRWLGLDWDEGPEVGGDFGPYRQTESLESYQQTARRLIDQGKAYVCYDTPQELEERRRAALARGEKPGYDGRCRNLSDDERRRFEAEGRPQAIRFAMPGDDVTVNDLIRGEVLFRAGDLPDFVILRSDGTPTYLLAAAVDDVRMKMTHVIRGEDLLPSTPRQLEIIKALGADPPAYAHLPLIMGPDHQPLSKRHGAVAVEWFRDEGFLPEAMVNYLALLGWSYDAETTFFSRDELIAKFDLSKVSHNPAAFDVDKLKWMNGHYIRETDDARLAELVQQALIHEGLDPNPELVSAAIPLIKTRMQTILEGAGLIRFLFVDEVVPDDDATKMLGAERADYLREAVSRLEAIEEWTHEEIDRVLRALKDERGLSSKQAFQPVRAAVTGTLVSPPLFESLELLGQERALERLRRAAEVSQPVGGEPAS